jgi:hypothetical protein
MQPVQVEVLEHLEQLLIKLLQGWHAPPDSAFPVAHVRQVVALEQVTQDVISVLQNVQVPPTTV